MLNLHCLPADIRDRFGRPVLVVDVAAPSENTNALKPYILQAFERLRVHLKKLFDDAGPRKNHPPLQYVILLDLKAVSLQNIVRGFFGMSTLAFTVIRISTSSLGFFVR